MSTNPGTTDQPGPTAALVTGATGGIGRAICLALAALARQQGRPLRIAAAASRPGVALDALLAELTAAGAGGGGGGGVGGGGGTSPSLVPLGRIGTPADVAQAVCYLADAPYVTGQSLVVDGGVADHMLTMIPGRPGR
ncbi:MAG: SDR family oxidoreductase [Burkholderiales bacterium]|nr:SDR family oxidoreductase [Burkholderiales bacterium]